MREISDETLNGLATKFEMPDLSDDERAVIDKVLERAADGTPETSGFVVSEDELFGVRGVQEPGLQGIRMGDGNPIKPQSLSPMVIKLGTNSSPLSLGEPSFPDHGSRIQTCRNSKSVNPARRQFR